MVEIDTQRLEDHLDLARQGDDRREHRAEDQARGATSDEACAEHRVRLIPLEQTLVRPLLGFKCFHIVGRPLEEQDTESPGHMEITDCQR